MTLKEIQFWLANTRPTRDTDYYFNKAQNELQLLIVDGERRLSNKLKDSYDGEHRKGSVI